MEYFSSNRQSYISGYILPLHLIDNSTESKMPKESRRTGKHHCPGAKLGGQNCNEANGICTVHQHLCPRCTLKKLITEECKVCKKKVEMNAKRAQIAAAKDAAVQAKAVAKAQEMKPYRKKP
jgi:hypothetical protein